MGKEPKWGRLTAEGRRQAAECLYELEMLFREDGCSDFIYDEKNDLFRFRDGRFAFSRKHANLRLLQEREYMS